MEFGNELDVCLRARFTLIVLVTREEERAVEAVKAVCDRSGRATISWDVADGFQIISGKMSAPPTARDPMTALEAIGKDDSEALYVLKDFHDCWTNAQVRRRLRNLAQQLKFTRKSLVVTTPLAIVPDELKDDSVVIEYPMPTVDELGDVLDILGRTPSVRVELTALGREKLLQAALGLSAAQARRVFSKAIVTDGRLDDEDIELVTEEKKAIIRESEALQFYSVGETPDQIGGLDVLKRWLRLREKAFTHEAHDYGLPAPKGVVLVGIPGTGKSLTAKMIGNLWRLPLLRLDVGALFGSLVGESEQRARRALRVAETVAPCVLWIDEVEKALGQGDNDGGTSARVLGSILTWMQDKTAPCFVVATANDISRLPPELLRKGRFDELFFLDLPTVAERRAILDVHIRKRRRLPSDFDVETLAKISGGYVGAELEQAIIDAMYSGFNEGREFTTADVVSALRHQVPLSVSSRETIEGLRQWLREGRAQSASFDEVGQAEAQFVPLEIRSAS